MLSVLTITYNGVILFDGEVTAFRWDDVPGQSVTVTGQIAKPKAASTGRGLSTIADLIAQASKAKTVEKRRELTEETAAKPEPAEIAKDADDD